MVDPKDPFLHLVVCKKHGCLATKEMGEMWICHMCEKESREKEKLAEKYRRTYVNSDLNEVDNG